MLFVDLFAGLGGFHIALQELGHECVFASEIDQILREVYQKNFGISPAGDIRKVPAEQIPPHDILCGGFPCTPFSKAGKQLGVKDKKHGDLFSEIVRILDYHRPKYFILENVQNLYYFDGNRTWVDFEKLLREKLKYSVSHKIYSPHEFGIPQNRKRLFIVGSKKGLSHFNWIDEYKTSFKTDIHSILNGKEDIKRLSKERIQCINVWQKFLNKIPKTEPLDIPIWAAEFGATYPYENSTPFSIPNNILGKYKGAFGMSLKGFSSKEKFSLLPSYARTQENEFPNWKKRFIRLNREFYEKYKSELIDIIPQIQNLNVSSWQKFEWNCQELPRKITNYILQFRASGLRVKKNDFAPSLVCPSTQIPILGWENRYLSRKEALKLHSMEKLKHLPESDTACFRALGNAVNVSLVKMIAKKLII